MARFDYRRELKTLTEEQLIIRIKNEEDRYDKCWALSMDAEMRAIERSIAYAQKLLDGLQREKAKASASTKNYEVVLDYLVNNQEISDDDFQPETMCETHLVTANSPAQALQMAKDISDRCVWSSDVYEA